MYAASEPTPASVEDGSECGQRRPMAYSFSGRFGRDVVMRRPVVGWRVNAGRTDVGVEHRPEVLVETPVGERQPRVEVVAEVHCRTDRRLQSPVQVDALAGEVPQVDVVTAVGARDVRIAAKPRGRRRQGLDGGEGNADIRSVQEALQQPPDDIATAVAARGAGAHGHGEVHLTAGLVQLLGDLGTRLTGADHEHGTVVSADRLAHMLWGDGQPAEPVAALHTLVWRLREAVRAAGCDGAVRLLTRAPGYLLDLDGEQVDVVRFEWLMRTAGSQPPDRAAALLEEALSLWRGPAYAEFADDEFARAEAARLEELRLAAGSDWVDAAIALDRPGDTLGRLAALVAADPLRERPRAQLMRALHRLGRSADALQTFRDYRDLLADELGLDPSQQLRDLEVAILRQDPEPDRASPVAGTPGPRPPPAGNLRLELTDLVGRVGDAAVALAALDDARVVTLTGVGGVGKTRLALRVAADAQPRYRDGAWLCELVNVGDATAVPDVVATTLGVQQRQGLTITDRLIEYLRPRRLLLLLDNCEHVLDAAAALADALVRGCPGLTVLATSREPLGTDGERMLPVQPLPVPPASISGDVPSVATVASVALFCRRAASASPAFALTGDNVAAVAEICRRLDGLPLALELAATRVPSFSPQEIADRLERRLQFLRSGRRIREERHRTLASVVDWSYRLLTPLEQAVFERCSVFMGAFSLDAAVSVTGGAEPEVAECEVTDSVAGLVDKSMLVAHADTTPTRFTMLETLRAYGRQRLAERGEDVAACLAHASYHVELAEAAGIGLRGPEEATWAETLAAVLDDLRSSHQWALAHQPALAMRLSAALIPVRGDRRSLGGSRLGRPRRRRGPAGSAAAHRARCRGRSPLQR